MSELVLNILKITGLIVWLCGFGVALTFLYAFVDWIYFWRWGKGDRWVKTGRLPHE
jgi:hypothetical protein